MRFISCFTNIEVRSDLIHSYKHTHRHPTSPTRSKKNILQKATVCSTKHHIFKTNDTSIKGNRQKSSLRKVFGNKVLNFGTKKYFWRKKIPRLRTFFQWHFVLGLQKFVTFLPKFLFPGFFSESFFPVTFLHRFQSSFLGR